MLDLTASNPTQCGFTYDGAGILAALGDRAALVYDPEPRGMLRAREAVCAYYAARGAAVDPQQIFLTTGTSEAYSWLFRLLCDAGDEVLIAQPSYPLFDFLAQIEDVRLVAYPLVYDHGWQIDFAGLRERITARTKAIAVVHPNNPTGHYTKAAERRELERICAEHGLALVVDEVFLDSFAEGESPLCGHNDSAEGKSFAVGEQPCLTFVLSGISKIAALPQMKLAWIATSGPESAVRATMERLEVIADTYLSMNAPIQLAAPALLSQRKSIQPVLLDRLRANLQYLDHELATQKTCGRLEVEGGWYVVLRVPVTRSDEDLAIALLREKSVLVHPGHFYDFPRDGYLVLSLITPPEQFRMGAGRIFELVNS